VHKVLAGYWLKRSETLAALPPLERGGWHAYRRQWAIERRHLPPQDLMAAGGWRRVQTLQRAYQHPDAATTYAVVALTPSALRAVPRRRPRRAPTRVGQKPAGALGTSNPAPWTQSGHSAQSSPCTAACYRDATR
jgi:hypothetical protein